MDPAYLVLVILALSPLATLVVHIVFSRLLTAVKPGISNQLVCILAILAGNAPVLALVWYARCLANDGACLAGAAPTMIYALLVYNALGYSYFHVFNMSETARRIRILYDLSLRPSVEMSEFTAYYDTGGILGVRLERLVKMGALKSVDGRYVTSGRTLLYAARAMTLWARLIGTPLAG